MINQTEQMLYRLSNLDAQQQRVNYQLGTKKQLQNGSEDANLFSREIFVDDRIRTYEGLKVQIERTTAQNGIADASMANIKKSLEFVIQETLKANTATTTDDGKKAIAVNIAGMKQSLLDLANTQVEGEYVFAGSDTSVKPFIEDADGNVTYVGDNTLRKIAVEDGSYRQRGVTGLDVMFYPSSIAHKGETLNFTAEEKIFDQDGNEWEIHKKVPDGGTLTFSSHPLIDGTGTSWTLNAAIPQLEDGSGGTIPATSLGGGNYNVTVPSGIDGLGYNQLRRYEEDGSLIPSIALNISGTSPDFSVTTPMTDGTKFEAKTNIFSVLDNLVNAIKKVDANGNPITNNESMNRISDGLGKIREAYDGVNVAHAELGGRNKVFEIAQERVNSKITQFKILYQDIAGANLTQAAAESKALELTYTALYSTINRTNQLSLVNFLN